MKTSAATTSARLRTRTFRAVNGSGVMFAVMAVAAVADKSFVDPPVGKLPGRERLCARVR
jgi:hypothetical protein